MNIYAAEYARGHSPLTSLSTKQNRIKANIKGAFNSPFCLIVILWRLVYAHLCRHHVHKFGSPFDYDPFADMAVHSNPAHALFLCLDRGVDSVNSLFPICQALRGSVRRFYCSVNYFPYIGVVGNLTPQGAPRNSLDNGIPPFPAFHINHPARGTHNSQAFHRLQTIAFGAVPMRRNPLSCTALCKLGSILKRISVQTPATFPAESS